jgi:hypothetical protein
MVFECPGLLKKDSLPNLKHFTGGFAIFNQMFDAQLGCLHTSLERLEFTDDNDDVHWHFWSSVAEFILGALWQLKFRIPEARRFVEIFAMVQKSCPSLEMVSLGGFQGELYVKRFAEGLSLFKKLRVIRFKRGKNG